MKRTTTIILLFCLFPSHLALGLTSIGKIANITGNVQVVRNHEVFIPVPGAALFSEDTLKTGPEGTMGILLLDDTIFALGNGSELKLDSFYFDPPNKIFSLATRMIKGTFVFISGLMGKMSPGSIKLSTPDGTVAIRGTKLAIQVNGKK